MRILIWICIAASSIVAFHACSELGGPDYIGGVDEGGGDTTETSFSVDVLPIFTGSGCAACHGGSGGLTVTTVAALLIGGDHGPAIIAGNADSSNLVLKLSALPPFGSRMPLGGTPLADSTIGVIREWINQGAKNN